MSDKDKPQTLFGFPIVVNEKLDSLLDEMPIVAGTTNNGARFDASQVKATGLTCLNCGWMGSEAMLKRIAWSPENDASVEGETTTVCPNCESEAWEPID